MTDPEMPPITDVSGGGHDPVVRRAAELSADYGAARGLAETYDAAGSKMRRWGAAGPRTMANGDLLQSSILSPVSFASTEAAVLIATTGPDGIFVESVGWEADAILIRVSIAAFEEKDRVARQTMEALDYAVGRIIGTALAGLARAAIPVAVVTGPSALMLWGLLPDGVKADLEDEGIDDVDALLTWLERHPEIERHLLNGGGGLLDGLSDGAWPGPGGLPFLPPFHATTEDAARSLGGLFGDEVPPGVAEFDSALPSGLSAPTSLRDLMENLSGINGTPTSPQPDGAIMIQKVTAADGAAHYIVYAPGTDDALPWHHDETVRDMSTNFNLIAGNTTTYGAGILEAMHDAGISRPGPGHDRRPLPGRHAGDQPAEPRQRLQHHQRGDRRRPPPPRSRSRSTVASTCCRSRTAGTWSRCSTASPTKRPATTSRSSSTTPRCRALNTIWSTTSTAPRRRTTQATPTSMRRSPRWPAS